MQYNCQRCDRQKTSSSPLCHSCAGRLAMLGKRHSIEARQKMRDAALSENNSMWKGPRAKLGAIHLWVKDRKPRPDVCERCGLDYPRDLANISQEYRRDVTDFEWLCRRCHMQSDGRFENLIRFEKGSRLSVQQRFNISKGNKLAWASGRRKSNILVCECGRRAMFKKGDTCRFCKSK